MAFQHHITARCADVYTSGHVYFGRIFEFCHAAFEELFGAAGVPLGALLDRQDWAMTLVHAEASFQRPIRLGERLRVIVTVERIGRSAVTFAFDVVGDDSAVCASVQHVHAFVDAETRERIPVPPEIHFVIDRLGLQVAGGPQADAY